MSVTAAAQAEGWGDEGEEAGERHGGILSRSERRQGDHCDNRPTTASLLTFASLNQPILHWSLTPTALPPLAAYVAIYVGRFRAARREGGPRAAGPRHALAFAGAVLVVIVAVASPLDGLGEDYVWHIPALYVAAAIMTVEQSTVFVIAFSLLFVRMLTQSDEDERRRERLEDAAAPA